MTTVPQHAYPRPGRVRADWLDLNGEWDFAFDDADAGRAARWNTGQGDFDRRIVVPYAYQSPESGIGDRTEHPVVWYRRRFEAPQAWRDRRILLHFGAVDYAATVWVNGAFMGQHRGGYTPFAFDVTDALGDGENIVVVRVEDRPDIDQPRGKQRAKSENFGCWYTPVTGIWQTVWLEPLADVHIAGHSLVTHLDGRVEVELELNRFEPGLELEIRIARDGEAVATHKAAITAADNRWVDPNRFADGRVALTIPEPLLWSPEQPQLYDLTAEIRRGGDVVDRIGCPFGVREITVKDGRVHLNGRPYFLRMVLDQGFWPEGYTPADPEALAKDVAVMKAMGFNGVRKHQKIEAPQFYAECDRQGLLVWEELPSPYAFTPQMLVNAAAEWREAIERDRNHPSIMAWVPVNESWGFDPLGGKDARAAQARHGLEFLYHLTKALDPTRLVISNDGWQQGTTDLITIHEYTQDPAELTARYQAFAGDMHAAAFSHKRPILLPATAYNGQPILVTEFGGCKVATQGEAGWGYGKAAADFGEMVERIASLVKAICAQEGVSGYCYTQLTDVEQEVNGLLYPDHKPKVPPDLLRKAFFGVDRGAGAPSR
ncbi:MAG TPA: glycoside hydrolase family 2 TIM barrel-domain containing protein [Limnochordia bacterium]|nr:glycoside hydrolase family 2 TIM barrel-domain containing protein [Limnochordia bacterium]